MRLKNLFPGILLAFSWESRAQMVAEHTYSSPMPGVGIVAANASNSITGPVLVNLAVSGRKYAVCEAGNLNLYNLDHTLWKAIPLPSGISSAVVFFISQNLFKLDGLVEYAISYTPASGTKTLYVKDELGNTLNTVSGMYWMYLYKSSHDSSKAVLWNTSPTSGMVFALPGNLPCDDCTGSSGTTNITQLNGSPTAFISDPIPNPTDGQTRIEFKLPAGIEKAKIVLFNSNGQVVKSYQVVQGKESITIDTSDLQQGVYHYSLQTSAGNSISKKVMVIH